MAIRNVPTILSDRDLKCIISGASPFITTSRPEGILPEQIQPSSLDLTLGDRVYGMGMASLPQNGEPVAELLKRSQYDFALGDGSFLQAGYTFVIDLIERLELPPGFSAKFSPKSSTGRTDVFVRVVADGVPQFDRVPEGFRGKLYLEITPLSFPVFICRGLSLVQMRITAGDARLSGKEVAIKHSQRGIFLGKMGEPVPMHELAQAENGVYMHVDLDRDVVGFASRRTVDSPLPLYGGGIDPYDYWEPIRRPRDGSIKLDRDRFYLLATKERVRIPHELSGDIAPYDASAGEFRTHYAGFFDPGFGGETGIVGVLEVRGREVPHRLVDNHPICLIVFERVSEVDKPYEGHYQNSGPSLSKHFKDRYKVWEG